MSYKLRNENWMKEEPEEELPDTDECPELIDEMNRFLDDPITATTGETGDLGRLLTSLHRKRHGCEGVLS